MKSTSRLGFAAATIAAGMLAVSLPASSASDPVAAPEETALASVPEGVSPELLEQMRWQAGISGYVDELVLTAQASGRFTGFRFDHDRGALIIFGVGSPPAAVQKLMAAHPAAAEVSWTQVPFSEEKLLRAMATVSMSRDGVTSVSVDNNFAGLRLGVADKASVSVPAQIESVPVTGVVEQAPAVSAAARGDENNPLRGGQRATFATPNGNSACSTGFRVFRGSNEMMLTAGHCTWNHNDANTHPNRDVALWGNGSPVGETTDYAKADWDVQLIDGHDYGTAIYTGGSNSSDRNYLSGGTGVIGDEEALCIGGGFSGARCGTVTAPLVNRGVCTDATTCRNIVQLAQVTAPSWAMAGQGDSGSPVYQRVDLQDLNADVRIHGTFTSFDTGAFVADCPAFATIFGIARTCSRRVYVTSFYRFKDEFSTPLTLFN